jgi:hypothetical protein
VNTTTQNKEKDAQPVALPADLRDYFAAAALQNMTVDSPYAVNADDAACALARFSVAARAAYQYADAMLEARLK